MMTEIETVRDRFLPAARLITAFVALLLPLLGPITGMARAQEPPKVATEKSADAPTSTLYPETDFTAEPKKEKQAANAVRVDVSGIFANLTEDEEKLRKAVDAKIRAEAALLVDVTNGQILYAKNIHQQHEPASTTKLLTALLAVELRDMNGRLLITEEDTKVEPSHVPLIPGEVVEAKALLASTLIGSDNDSAIALARYAAGDLDSFMALMNDFAKRLGCRGTIFQNPNGLPADNQYTTAADLMIIFEHVLQKPLLVKILETPRFTLETRAKTQLVRNHNKLLGRYDGMGPAKTGWTRASKHTYAAEVTRGDRTLRLTLLKSPNKWNDATWLFDYGFSVSPPTPPDVFLAAEDIEERLISGATPSPTPKELLKRLAKIREDLETPVDPDEVQVAELVLHGPQSSKEFRSPLAREYFAAATHQPPDTEAVKVQRGDTLQKIARRHNCTMEEIIEINDISNPNRIYPGDVLLIPTN